jgi:hypothetical protein
LCIASNPPAALLQCREQQWLVRELNDALPANLYLAQLDLCNNA